LTLSIALAAGGTGGHLLPALAVADAIRAKAPQTKIVLIGSRRHLDAALAEKIGLEVITTDVISFGKPTQIPSVAIRLVKAVREAKTQLRERGISAVLGFGGYPSLPGVLAATRIGARALVHEANALPKLGLANSIATRMGATPFGGWPTTGSRLKRDIETIGVPLRAGIADLDVSASRLRALETLGIAAGEPVVLVMGGSLGARRLNDATIDAIRTAGNRFRFIISTGADDHERVATALKDAPGVAVHPFIDDMATAYAAADVVVARAGAVTVAELATLGLPAVLVPLPIARADEQTLNAQQLVARAQAQIVADARLDGASLLQALDDRLAAGRVERDRSHIGAAERLADALLGGDGHAR
jgi:UDP-N-acetylglucosamine--N-acetylmuramyl-(pentapeptide) pyrophosphoryl-undecaprenol N-acetylglucosamine transferase